MFFFLHLFKRMHLSTNIFLNFLLVSEVEFSYLLVTYNTQCSFHQAPSLMPITQVPYPTFTSPPAPLSLFPRVQRLPLNFHFIFPSLPLCSSVLFLKFHMIGIIQYLSFSDLFHLALYSLVSSRSLQMARFHSF